MTENPTPWRPRWWYFGAFAVLAAVHLSRGWTDDAAIGLPLGFGCTLLLVFVRRLPSWVTGERTPAEEGDFAHERLDSTVESTISRAALGKHLRRRTFVLWGVLVLGVAVEVVVFAAVGGVLPWVLLVPVILVALATAAWRGQVAHAARLLADGPWTGISAAVVEEDVWPGWPVCGWAVLPDGIRARFTIEECPPDVAAELLARRRLWIAGEPREGEFATGLPDGDSFAIGEFDVKAREYRRRRARTRLSS